MPEPTSIADRFSATAAVGTASLPLALSAEVFASGLNGAIARPPRSEADALPLLELPLIAARWKPTRQRVLTVGLTFPAGLEFVPPKPPKAEEGTLRKILGPAANVPAGGHGETVPEEGAKRKPTRLKPPADAISLQDRLFYLLQPPL